jgi:hypothetical protein
LIVEELSQAWMLKRYCRNSNLESEKFSFRFWRLATSSGERLPRMKAVAVAPDPGNACALAAPRSDGFQPSLGSGQACKYGDLSLSKNENCRDC